MVRLSSSLRKSDENTAPDEWNLETQDSQKILKTYWSRVSMGASMNDHFTEPDEDDEAVALPAQTQDHAASVSSVTSLKGNRPVANNEAIALGSGSQLTRDAITRNSPPATQGHSPSRGSGRGAKHRESSDGQFSAVPQSEYCSDNHDSGKFDDYGDKEDVAHVRSSTGPARPAKKCRKMESSQSPTQSNDGRSYEQYDQRSYDQYFRTASPGRPSATNDDTNPMRLLRSSPGGHPTSLDVDDHSDTDHLDFENAPATAAEKTTSPAQDDSGFVDLGNFARPRNPTSQIQAPSPYVPFPETPAPPQNPFRLGGRSQLLAPSQLFGGTQFSSAVKLASPTSSRPSPADFLHNSISPNVFISSPLKARGLRSSPVPNATSSPQVLPGTTSSPRFDGEVTSSPVRTASTKGPVIPESSHCEAPAKKSAPGPMGTYEPMHKSQERRSNSQLSLDGPSSGDDADDQESITRRLKAKNKKEAASKNLVNISIPRASRVTKPDEIEVPSTNKRKPRNGPASYSTRRRTARSSDEKSTRLKTVAGSQERRVQPDDGRFGYDADSTQSEIDEGPESDTVGTPAMAPPLTRPMPSPAIEATPYMSSRDTGIGDAIPETSPPEERFEVPEESNLSPADRPLLRVKSTPNFQSSPPALSTRFHKAKASSTLNGGPGSTSSSLSNLGSTPAVSSSTTPATQDSGPARLALSPGLVSNSSPAVAKYKRRATHERLPALKMGSVENLRHSARIGKQGSASPDELSRSQTTTPTFEHSLRGSRASAASKTFRAVGKPQQTQRGTKLFEGMALAISFQSRKPGESSDHFNTRMESAAAIEKAIKGAGGRILEHGFDELFDVLPAKPVTGNSTSTQVEPEISLTPEGRSTGFAALIADGHSRKVKYIQALALGLPCIASRWITSCLNRNELLDWTPYLLCAGQSAFLGDAIRSRTLVSYNASTASLVDVIGQRTKFLEESRVLLVMKKSLENKKMAYVFLARVLGASLTRVYSADEAKAEMKAAEDAGRPFNWVYADGKSEQGNIFAVPASRPGDARKRKRGSAAAAAAADEPPNKKIRTLSDELVIQSLILGRLIEEGEMGE